MPATPSTRPRPRPTGRATDRPSGPCFRLTVEYDGGRYAGWQEQPNAKTIQGELRAALRELFRVREFDLQGAGRTDAGVHALAQIAHLKLPGMSPAVTWPRAKLLIEANRLLPTDIVLLDIAPAAATFHARHDAVARAYLYRLSTRKSAFHKSHLWWLKADLDLAAMRQALALLPGLHDFRQFRAEDDARPDESTLVEMRSATLDEDGDFLAIRLEASHFLWRMVRRIVGVLARVGTGEVSPAQWSTLLAGRPARGIDVPALTSPASGLFLEKVLYP